MLRIVYRWGLRIILLIWVCLLILVGARFTEQNPQMLQIDLVFWVLPEASTGLVLSVTLFLGVLLGICCFFPAWIISKARMRRLRVKLSKAELKLETLSQNSLVDLSRSKIG